MTQRKQFNTVYHPNMAKPVCLIEFQLTDSSFSYYLYQMIIVCRQYKHVSWYLCVCVCSEAGWERAHFLRLNDQMT